MNDERMTDTETTTMDIVVAEDDITSTSDPFVLLAPETMQKIVDFLRGNASSINAGPHSRQGMKALISLASTDHYLQRVVYTQFPYIWECLDLCDNVLLTDSRLHVFLERIQAVRTVRVIRLTGCIFLTGVGLAPLVGSQVLARIDWYDSSRMDYYAVTGILGPMLNFELRTVNINRYMMIQPNLPSMTFVLREFMNRLAFANARRLLDRGLRCSHCERSFRTIIRDTDQVLLDFSDETQCSDCGCYSCGDCHQIVQCHDCYSPICSNNCAHACSECGDKFCKDCALKYNCCSECNQMVCRHYECQVRCDDDCEEIYCLSCGMFCDHCASFLCPHCSNVYHCDDECGQFACEDCAQNYELICSGTPTQFKKCTFNDQCYFCASYFEDNEFPEPAYECPYCLRNFCQDCCEGECFECPRQCSPNEIAFPPRRQGNITKKCHCGKVALHNGKGQQFVCGFVAK